MAHDDRRAAWHGASHVLCVRLDTIGDVLMTTPALRALRGMPARRRITLLTSGPGAAIARNVPEVDEVIAYEAPWLKRGAGTPTDGAADLAMVQALRVRRFDAAVIFTVYSQSALPAAMLCTLAGVPLRAAHCRENPYALLSDWQRESEPEQRVRHEVERQLDLVGALGFSTGDRRLSLEVPPAARASVRRRLAALGVMAGTRVVVLHPGATAASRRYPPALFAAAARDLVARTGARLLVTGDASEAATCADASAGVPGAVSLAGALSLDELCALIADAPLLITNNTGPAHIAAALGTPVVDLYALTNPQHTPWMVPSRVLNHDVPCRGCQRSVCPEGHHDCLVRVPPLAVAEAALDLLAPPLRRRPRPTTLQEVSA
jgi:lipopolysaccharide heptosyltransferase II